MIKKLLIIICLIFISAALIYVQADELFVYDSKGKRDPFFSLVSPEGILVKIEPFSDTSELNLEGIIYDPKGRSYAIINAQTVASGDTVGRFEILGIKKNQVILLRDGEKIEIELKEGE